MKTITQILGLCLTLLVGTSAYSQLVQTSPATNSSTCDGAAYLMPGSGISNWSWLDANSNVLQTGGDSLTGLCFGPYSLNYQDSTGGNATFSFYLDTLPNGSCNGFYAYISSQSNPTSPNACDGSLTMAASGGTAPYNYTWNNGAATASINNLCSGTYTGYLSDANGCQSSISGTLYPDSTAGCGGFSIGLVSSTPVSASGVCDGTADVIIYGGSGSTSVTWDNMATGTSVSGLCEGYHTVNAVDSNGCQASLSIYIYGDSTNMGGSLYGWVYTTDVSADGLCDGTAYTDVYGGTAPYSFVYGNGSVTQTVTGLCAGFSSVLVTDAAGDTLILNFLIGTPSNTIDNNTYPDSTNLDTLNTNLIENCIVTYFGIDTAYISNAIFTGTDSIAVDWTVVDANGSYVITTTYYFNSGYGVYQLILQLFCPQRGQGDFLTVKDQILIDPSVMGLDQLVTQQAFVGPNPFNDVIQISLKEAAKSQLEVLDLNGRVLYQSEMNGTQAKLDLSALSSGQYLLRIRNNNGVQTHKLVK